MQPQLAVLLRSIINSPRMGPEQEAITRNPLRDSMKANSVEQRSRVNPILELEVNMKPQVISVFDTQLLLESSECEGEYQDISPWFVRTE